MCSAVIHSMAETTRCRKRCRNPFQFYRIYSFRMSNKLQEYSCSQCCWGQKRATIERSAHDLSVCLQQSHCISGSAPMSDLSWPASQSRVTSVWLQCLLWWPVKRTPTRRRPTRGPTRARSGRAVCRSACKTPTSRWAAVTITSRRWSSAAASGATSRSLARALCGCLGTKWADRSILSHGRGSPQSWVISLSRTTRWTAIRQRSDQ